MKHRRRGRRSELEDDGVLLQHRAEERKTVSRVDWFQATGRKEDEEEEPQGEGQEREGCPGKVPPLSALGLSLSWWAWQPGLTVASGLLVALLLALTQAYWVNSIHENLLWFSQLTVRAPWTPFFGTKAQVQLTFCFGKLS